VTSNNHNRLTYFSESAVRGIELPQRFTFPFYYEPHPLAQIAAAELQHYLETQTDLDHNFGLVENQEGLVIGKMFGVLVVQDKEGKLGYLSGFSGKLAGSNIHSRFVPPVFDMLIENSFFLKEQYILNSINQQIKDIESDEEYKKLKKDHEQFTILSAHEISAFKEQLKKNKLDRKKQRQEQKNILDDEEYAHLEAYLIRYSLHDKHQFNVLSSKWVQLLEGLKAGMAKFDEQIEALKKERREKSAALQQQLFEQYEFPEQRWQKEKPACYF
jgi:tRNA pseudouridine32 synthase/23S rRNA pseudouridine746 synthase